MSRIPYALLSAVVLITGAALPAFAQSEPVPGVKGEKAGHASFQKLEGKWVRYASTPPLFFEVSTREGRPHVQFVSIKSGKHYDCTNVRYESGVLSFDFPGTPVPSYELKLAAAGQQLIGEVTSSNFPYPRPVQIERVMHWPSAEEAAAKAGSAGPIIVRQ